MNDALLLDEDEYLACTARLAILNRMRAQSHAFSHLLRAGLQNFPSMSRREREALRLIAIAEKIPLSELATELNVGISTTSLIVNRLERLEVCFRDHHVEDARHKVVYFDEDSDLGPEISRDLSVLAAKVEWKFAAMTTHEIETLLGLLQKLQ